MGILKTILQMLFQVFSFVIYPVVIALAILFLIFVFYLLKYRFIDKKKRKKSYLGKFEKGSILKRIFVDFPSRMALDFFELDPNRFNQYGIHMICGVQGSGKTVTAMYLLRKWKTIYPKLKIDSNISCGYADRRIDSYQDLIKHTNGIYGVVEFVDEMHNWFLATDWQNFPPEMLSEISQQRKQTKCIMGTCQVFSKIGKPLREQTDFLYMPVTLFGCLTIVRKTDKRYFDEDTGKVKKWTGYFFFVHDKELREVYDTYEKVDRLFQKGFDGNSERMRQKK